jgi:hypothetical protein
MTLGLLYNLKKDTVQYDLQLQYQHYWYSTIVVVRGYINARMSIAIVRATHICLRGSRVPTSTMSNRRPQWEDKAGLSLFHSST